MKLILLQKPVTTHHSVYFLLFFGMPKAAFGFYGRYIMAHSSILKQSLCVRHFQYYLVLFVVIPCIHVDCLKIYHSKQSLFHFCESGFMAQRAHTKQYCIFLCKKEKEKFSSNTQFAIFSSSFWYIVHVSTLPKTLQRAICYIRFYLCLKPFSDKVGNDIRRCELDD